MAVLSKPVAFDPLSIDKMSSTNSMQQLTEQDGQMLDNLEEIANHLTSCNEEEKKCKKTASAASLLTGYQKVAKIRLEHEEASRKGPELSDALKVKIEKMVRALQRKELQRMLDVKDNMQRHEGFREPSMDADVIRIHDEIGSNILKAVKEELGEVATTCDLAKAVMACFVHVGKVHMNLIDE